MAGLYIVAGLMHFILPKIYLRIMPRYLPKPLLLVYLSGLAEIVLGIAACFRTTQYWALSGIILMLLIFLLVHIHMLSGPKAAAGFPKWLLLLRIPVQFLLMYWAYMYLDL